MIELLKAITSIEGEPHGFPTALEWKRIQHIVGPLPLDYISYIDYFGDGTFHDYLVIYPPQMPKGEKRILCPASAADIKAYKDLAETFSDEIGQLIWYPTFAGFLPFGHTMCGDALFWKTDNPAPNEWKVIVWRRDNGSIHNFDGSLIDLILWTAIEEHDNKYFARTAFQDRPLIFRSHPLPFPKEKVAELDANWLSPAKKWINLRKSSTIPYFPNCDFG